MTAERDSMTLNEVSAPALGVEERSDEAPGPAAPDRPGPGGCGQAEAAPVHRRSIGCGFWRGGSLHTARRGGPPASPRGVVQLASDGLAQGAAQGLAAGVAAKKRGAKPAERNPLDAKLRALEAQVARLEHELHTAHTILDVQGKVAGLLGLNLEHERALDRGPTACGAGRRGAGLPSTGRVTGELLPSSEVNSRAPAAPSNARPGAV